MIDYLIKNLATVDRGVLIHGCNAQGAMNSGVAKAVRSTWPGAFEKYVAFVKEYGVGRHLLGQVAWYHHSAELHIANAITQEYYGKDGRKYADPRAIQLALRQVYAFASSAKLPIYMPPIGCGLGGLNWEQDVEPIVKDLDLMYPDLQLYVCDI